MPDQLIDRSVRTVRRASRPVPTMSAWLWFTPRARSRRTAFQVARRAARSAHSAPTTNISIASRDS